MKQTKDYTIPLIGFIIIAILAASCSTSRYNQESVYLKEGGELDKFHTKCKLVDIKPNMYGYRTTFLADKRTFEKSDTIVRMFTTRKGFYVDSCYYIRKTRLEK